MLLKMNHILTTAESHDNHTLPFHKVKGPYLGLKIRRPKSHLVYKKKDMNQSVKQDFIKIKL